MSPLQLTCDFSKALADSSAEELESLTSQIFLKLMTSQVVDNLKRFSEPLANEEDITQFVPGIVKMQVNPDYLETVIGIFKEHLPTHAQPTVLLEREPYRQAINISLSESVELLEKALKDAIASLNPAQVENS